MSTFGWLAGAALLAIVLSLVLYLELRAPPRADEYPSENGDGEDR